MSHVIPKTGDISLSLFKVHTFATCWRIVRTDSTEFRFTDHDRPLVILGDVYTPTDGISASAVQQDRALRENNFQARGVISSSAITDSDLRLGKFRGAVVTEFLVDWANAWASPLITNRYFIERTEHNTEMWTAEIAGLEHRLKGKFGRRYTRNCQWTLGDSRCQQVLTSFQDSGSVWLVNQNRLFIMIDIVPTTTGVWDFGVLTWTSGNNDGVSIEIESNVGTVLKLRFTMPLDIQVGDTFDLTQGCDKLIQTCLDKFDNVINFGGFPTIPGLDKLTRGPTGGGGVNDKKQS